MRRRSSEWVQAGADVRGVYGLAWMAGVWAGTDDQLGGRRWVGDIAGTSSRLTLIGLGSATVAQGESHICIFFFFF